MRTNFDSPFFVRTIAENKVILLSVLLGIEYF